MIPKEERDALSKILRDTILQNVPMAIEANNAEGEFVYRIDNNSDGNLEPFCRLLVRQDHLEVGFPEIPDPGGPFEPVEGGSGCRLIICKRTDIPGELLNNVIRKAAEST